MNLIVEDVMTKGAHSVNVESSVHDAAVRMDELDVGVLPVTDADRIVGIVTDRDIVVRGLVYNLPPSAMPLSDVMTSHVRSCYLDQPLSEVLQQMRTIQIRRMPVLDRANRLVGMLALADVATAPRVDLSAHPASN